MRCIYTVLFYLILPFILLRLYWRGFKAPEYRKRWTERLAIYNRNYSSSVIWFHAVSVGEAEAVFPLIKQLQKHFPSDPILVTTTTPTGSARVQTVLAGTVRHVYLPYDLPDVIHRFLATFHPRIAIMMEKEIWPNLYAQCSQTKIPLLIINARLSANSAKAYKKIPGLIHPALACVSWIATQTEEDRQRFIEIGARKESISVAGNLKFDLQLDEKIILRAKKLKKELFKGRYVWIIASTHEGEEVLFFEIYPVLKKRIPELLLLVVPRHPERFERTKRLADNMMLKTCMRSSAQDVTDGTDVYIADTMGELKLLYGTADICFVGGSLVPVGGHNILEPAATGVPVMFGPHMVNFKEIANNVLGLNAAVQCADKEEIIKALISLHDSPEYRNGLISRAKTFVSNNQGATEKISQLIEDFLSK